jgi:hypothetical protein
LTQVRDGVAQLLRHATPNGWLPFVSDAHLAHWRDLVADQLTPGAEIRTVEIFANRARIPDSEFLALLEPKTMQDRIFSHVTLEELDRFHSRAVVSSLRLTVRYLNGCTTVESV